MTSKIDSCCLRTNKYPFLYLRISRTLSLEEFYESKTHLFLSPFFKNLFGLKVHFNAKLWNFHPNLLFCKHLKEISRKMSRNQHGAEKGPMSQHCCNRFPMS